LGIFSRITVLSRTAVFSRTTVAVAAVAALAVAGGVTAFAVTHGHTAQASTASNTAAVKDAAGPPLRVLSVTPADGSRGVNGTTPVTVTFNQPVPASAALPRLSPNIPGSWQRTGDTAAFTPATGFTAGTHVRVTAAQTGGKDYSSAFTTGQYSTLRLQEVLAQLGYLPLTWAPAASGTARSGGAELSAAYSAPAGTFTWRGGYPAGLRDFWTQGSANTVDTGAIAGFEAAHGMRVNGDVSQAVWAALLKAAAAGKRNTSGYSYAVASESYPESLTIWHNGRQVFYSPANTGIPEAPTALGTFFVYEKLPFQVMQGTNPDGTSYSDPVEWVSYFNGGDAVHYFPRASYGWQQSLGCVELPWSTAEEAYGYLPYGTLVTVAS
jgi:hypothetical protein